MKNYTMEIEKSAMVIEDLGAAISNRESKIKSYTNRAKAAIEKGNNELVAELTADVQSLKREVEVQKNALERLREEHRQLVAEYNAL